MASEVPLEAEQFCRVSITLAVGVGVGPCFQHVLVGKLDFYDCFTHDI